MRGQFTNNVNGPVKKEDQCLPGAGGGATPAAPTPGATPATPAPTPAPAPPGEMKVKFAGDSGCLKSAGARKKLIRNSKDGCARFKLDGKVFKSIDHGGQCLDLFHRRDFGLWNCHGGGNQKLTAQGDKWCTTGKCIENAGAADGSGCAGDAQCASGLCDGGKCKAKAAVGGACSKDAACTTGMCVSDKCIDKQKEGAKCGAARECESNRCENGSCQKAVGTQLQEKRTKKCISDDGGTLNFKPCNKGDPAQLWGDFGGGVYQNAKTNKCISQGGYAC